MSKKLIYSVVTNQYDTIKPVKHFPGFDYWLFTDQGNLKVDGWEVKPLPKSSNPIKQQRLVKINSIENTPGYELTLYMDGNMEILENPQLFLDRFYTGGFLTCEHPKRSTLKEEGKEILRKKKDLPENVEKALSYAFEMGYQDDLGLFETMVVVRDKSPEVKKLEEKWTEIFNRNSHRDQLSLPLASFLSQVKVHAIPRAELFKYIKRNRGHNVSLKFFKGQKNPTQGIWARIANFFTK
ncbi:hypothetical protein JYB64_09255 [Algoriphagus aestuarii]|nr:hypothetical protein [Algoriphagus aestuarii]